MHAGRKKPCFLFNLFLPVLTSDEDGTLARGMLLALLVIDIDPRLPGHFLQSLSGLVLAHAAKVRGGAGRGAQDPLGHTHRVLGGATSNVIHLKHGIKSHLRV